MALRAIAGSTGSATPSGPAGGDLSGTYPNPTVSAVHATSGTINDVDIDNSNIGKNSPSPATFTLVEVIGSLILDASSPNSVLIGEGSANSVRSASPGVAGTLLASNGTTSDPTFQTISSIGIAPIASPAFTGTPTAPTAAAGTNTTQLATTAFAHTIFAAPPALGNTTPNAVSATTLSASGTVSGTGFSAYLASPPAIGGTAPAAGAFTTLAATTPVSVASGGTGNATLTANSVLLGEGTGSIAFAAPGAAATLLASNGTTSDPSFQTAAALNLASTTNPLSQFAATTSAQLAGVLSDETGTGNAVFNTSPVLITPTARSFVNINQSAGLLRTVQFATGTSGTGTIRAQVGVNGTAESGSNAGSDFIIGLFSDAGSSLSTPITITRATGLITLATAIKPSTTAGIVGTTAADNASAGSWGEFVTAQSAPTSLTTNTDTTITSISLTAGDWEVDGNVVFGPAATTLLTYAKSSVNTTAATQASSPFYQLLSGETLAAGDGPALSAPRQRINVSSTTTVYLVATANFTVSTCTASGVIAARRVR